MALNGKKLAKYRRLPAEAAKWAVNKKEIAKSVLNNIQNNELKGTF